MSTEKTSKINQLLRSVPTGTAILSSWLNERGYNADLQKRYRKATGLNLLGLDINYYCSDFLPAFEGLTELKSGDFTYKVSGPVRAMLECLYLVPQRQSLLECYEIMEGLNNLRPSIVQSLLEKCGSVKVKRLFLYLADKADHQWFNHLKTSDIDLDS